jgi:hypothetical protein
VPYQADYVIRLIEQLSGLVRGAKQRLGVAKPAEPEETVSDRAATDEVGGRAIGLVLMMDPVVASRLSPQTLGVMLQLADVHPEVLPLLAEAIELGAETLQVDGHPTEAEARRAQAAAVRSLM